MGDQSRHAVAISASPLHQGFEGSGAENKPIPLVRPGLGVLGLGLEAEVGCEKSRPQNSF